MDYAAAAAAGPNPNPKHAGRIAELKSQMANEQLTEQQRAQDLKTASHLQRGVLQAMEQVESSLDEQLNKLKEVESLGEDELDRLRERRKQQIKSDSSKAERWRANGHGELNLCTDEKDFFTQVKLSERVVIHFYRDTTRRCEVLDGHLLKLARMHLETKFIRVNVERSPFLCERLKIHTLPSLVLAKQGKTERTLVGFDDFGGDGFETEELESCLVDNGMLHESGGNKSTIKQRSGPLSSAKRLEDDWTD
ncbi:hypothetical protein BASA81_009826 [Batrachochytrium salamandrivorans]|nr:hypothetical protein BASA81_009826 [Batrachochytrium salamandrivorans]